MAGSGGRIAVTGGGALPAGRYPRTVGEASALRRLPLRGNRRAAGVRRPIPAYPAAGGRGRGGFALYPAP